MNVDVAVFAIMLRLRLFGLSAEQIDVVRCEDNCTALAYIYTDRPREDFTVAFDCGSEAERDRARCRFAEVV